MQVCHVPPIRAAGKKKCTNYFILHCYTNYGVPTGNLDSATTIEVIGLLKTSCRKYNQTILMVTHNEAIAQTCDRIIHIEDGMVTSGTHLFPKKGGDGVC